MRDVEDVRLLVVGINQPGHIGSYLVSAAKRLSLKQQIIDSREAEAGTRIGRYINWHFRDRRPGRLAAFGDRVVRSCRESKADLVLTTGTAPLDSRHIDALRVLGAKIINYSTDDPWNPRLRASWFLSAVPSYDGVFTPRRANIEEFRRSGVGFVHYLPFGYDEDTHRPWPAKEKAGTSSDLLFVGGCDEDRLPLITALIDAGLRLALFGGYWDRHPKTRPYWRGLADQGTIRAASAATSVCLCLVRRANRDEHVMRSFEAAAIGGCVLAEDTVDHRILFGATAKYFTNTTGLVREARHLVENMQIRGDLTQALRRAMSNAGASHTYTNRLASMIRLTFSGPKSGHDV